MSPLRGHGIRFQRRYMPWEHSGEEIRIWRKCWSNNATNIYEKFYERCTRKGIGAVYYELCILAYMLC